MNPNFPDFLYRGDSDKNNQRQLRQIYPGSAYGYLMTNLSNGGDGRVIFADFLKNLINTHVAIGWNKTHFLSFSADKAIAQKYAGECEKIIQEIPPACRVWDFALIEINTKTFSQKEIISPGIFLCQYPTNKRMNKNCDVDILSIMRLIDKAKPPRTILLIDVATYLKNQNSLSYSTAISNAERDKEWLILPLDPVENIPGEFTSHIDDGCISNFTTYKFT